MHLVFFANRKRLFQLRVFLSIPSGEWASLSVVGCQEEVVTPLQLGIPSDRICHATIYLHKFCKLAGGGMLTLGKGWNGLNIVGVTKASRNVMQNLMGTCLRWLRTRRRSRPCAPGQHEALDRAAFSLHPEDTLLAFMYDLYIVTMPDCARQAFDTAAHAVEGQCGIASNLGKTHVFAAEVGPPPPGIAELGEEVWCGDKPPASEELWSSACWWGLPTSSRRGPAILREERLLLDELPYLPDLQCAWLLLLFFASPRANHALRTLPPSEVEPYAHGHDQAVWEHFGRPSSNAWAACRKMPGRLGCSCPHRPSTAGLVCSRPNEQPRQHTGQHGWTRCRSSVSAFRHPQDIDWRPWSRATAAVPPLFTKTACWPEAGIAAPCGVPPITALAHHSQVTQAPETGRTAGSIMRRGRID